MPIQKMPNASINWENAGEFVLWDPSRNSIYDAIESAPDPIEDCELPDDALVEKGQILRFVPGAADAVLQSKATGDVDHATIILTRLKTTLEDPSQATITPLYAAMVATKTRGIVGKLCRSLAELSKPQSTAAANLFRELARKAPDREAVKIAIAAIGVLGSAKDEDLLWTLGRHNEFTNLASGALLSKATDPEHSIWTLSQHVHGWGRIHTVERLSHTQNVDIQHWLVRDGFRNTIMYEYLAGIAVVTGDLVSQLKTESPDDALLDGTADILNALVGGGPCPDISKYPEAIAVYELFIEHCKDRDLKLKRLLAIAQVINFLTASPSKRHPPPKYWSPEQIANGVAAGREVLSKPSHIRCLRETLETGEAFEAWLAHTVAKVLGLDLWGTTFQRALRGDEISWYVLLDTSDPHRIGQIIGFVEEAISIKDIATGPTKAIFPDQYKKNGLIIDYVAQELRRFPGMGWSILRAALQSPVIRTRNMAIRALDEWGPAHWSADVEPMLQQVLVAEPDPKIKERMQALLNRMR